MDDEHDDQAPAEELDDEAPAKELDELEAEGERMEERLDDLEETEREVIVDERHEEADAHDVIGHGEDEGENAAEAGQ